MLAGAEFLSMGISVFKKTCFYSRAREPQLLKPARLEPVLRNKRSHCSEKPAHCNEDPM